MGVQDLWQFVTGGGKNSSKKRDILYRRPLKYVTLQGGGVQDLWQFVTGE